MNNSRLKLREISLKGFKSIDQTGQSIPFEDVTVLIGANGSGKSNLISFFELLNYMTTQALQNYIGQHGFADSLLYFGAKQTSRIEASLHFADDTAEDTYAFSLAHAAEDTLIFTEEVLSFKKKNYNKPKEITLEPGMKEAGLPDSIKKPGNKVERIVYGLLSNCRVFQFHDTSPEAKIRNQVYIDDNTFLRDNGGNLAAFLYGIRTQKDGDQYYQRIVRYIKQMMPQFHDFALSPSVQNENYIRLNWTSKNSNYLFGPHQLSDGTLRFMALATLLLQPPQTMPAVIVLDEPELGLHPAAITLFASMVKKASAHAQIVLATQSTRLIDEFNAHQILVADYEQQYQRSYFKKLAPDELQEWLKQYSMSELWEKNVLGGRP